MGSSRRRFRDLGLSTGLYSPGKWNAITDVPGVAVGHVTRIQGDSIRTGVTAVLPHTGNIFQDKVPAGLAVGNGFGKLIGATQLQELGEIETPILLTNTLAAPRLAEALIDWTLGQPGNENVRSVNPIVGETNDGLLNNIRSISLSKADAFEAIQSAASGPVVEGCVGAGTGTVCMGWKGGIGTSSRLLPPSAGGYALGILAQTNFGGLLRINGRELPPHGSGVSRSSTAGSMMMILATDAPLSDRNLGRLASRGLSGLARAGASMSNGSGDYAIAFSVAGEVRRTSVRRQALSSYAEVPNDLLSPLFQAAIEASEEAIYNSLCMAETMSGFDGHLAQALPLELLNTA